MHTVTKANLNKVVQQAKKHIGNRKQNKGIKLADSKKSYKKAYIHSYIIY